MRSDFKRKKQSFGSWMAAAYARAALVMWGKAAGWVLELISGLLEFNLLCHFKRSYPCVWQPRSTQESTDADRVCPILGSRRLLCHVGYLCASEVSSGGYSVIM